MSLLYRVRTRWDGWQGAPGLSTFYFKAAAPPTSAEALTVVNRVRAAWDVYKTTIPALVSAQVSGIVDVIDDANGNLNTSFTVAQPAVVAGTNAGGSGPAEVAIGMVLDSGTVVGGRRLRGRCFISPVPGTLTVSLLPPTALVTNVNALGVALIGATPPLATAPLVIWKRPKPTALGSSQVALSAVVSGKWWTLRSRRD